MERDKRGRFIKGHSFGKRFKKGYKHTVEWKKKNSLRMKGNNYGFKKGVSYRKGMKSKEITRKKISAYHQGISVSDWKSFSNTKKYSIDFYRIRDYIIKRDNYKCRLCRNSIGILDVHHIDYNKSNNTKDNLITLCHSCHSRTNYKRSDWIKYFKQIKIDGGESHAF